MLSPIDFLQLIQITELLDSSALLSPLFSLVPVLPSRTMHSSHSHTYSKPTSGSSTSTPSTTTAQQQTDALQKILASSTSSSTTTALARKIRGTHVWKINNFSMLPRNKEKPITSPNFVAGEALWTIELYPFGVKDDGKLSIFVRLLDMPDCDKDKPFLPVKYRFRCVSLTGLQDYAPIDWEQRNWLLDHEWGYLSLPREAIYEYSVDDSIIFVLDLEVTVGLTITHMTSSPSIVELRTANQELLGKDMSTLIRKGIRTDVKIVLRQSCSDSLPSSPTPTTSSSSLARASPTPNKRRRIMPETGGKGTLDEDCWEWEDGEDVVIPAHKLILSMRSPIFHAMFNHDMKENAENIVYIDDMDRATLCRMLDYIYTSNVHGHPSREWMHDYPRSRYESGSTSTPSTTSSTQHPTSSRYEQGNATSYIYNTTYPNTTYPSSSYPSYPTPTSSYRKRQREEESCFHTTPVSSWDDVMNLFRAADKYCLEGLSDWCGLLIGKYLTTDNVIATLQLADRYRTCPSGSSMMKRVAKEFLMSSFDDVINSQPIHLMPS